MKVELKNPYNTTPEEAEKFRTMENDDRYMMYLNEIENDPQRKDLILTGQETAGNFLGYRNLDPQRYYPDMAKRMNDIKLNHMKHAQEYQTKAWGSPEKGDEAIQRYLDIDLKTMSGDDADKIFKK